MKIAAFKIYTDSADGYRDGVPRLLDMLDRSGVSGSFFFGMGTEDDGGMVSRLFGEGREIVAAAPGIIRDAYRRGHDCGIYGWNPREWQSRLDKIRDTTIEADLRRAVDYFFSRTGARPNGCAAPGCRISYASLRIQDDLRFRYCSDTYGSYPFFPKISWKTFGTPQIPATLPPLENVLRKCSAAAVRERLDLLLSSLPDGLSVIPLNASIALVSETANALSDLIEVATYEGVKIMPLVQVIDSLAGMELPVCKLEQTTAFGISRDVAVQSHEIERMGDE